jgi:nucleotide-binding universal stress UspA family protein
VYTSILIATDGSELADLAVDHGIAFARDGGRKVIVLTVTEPFAIFAVSPAMVEDTPVTYAARVARHASEVLGRAEAAARAAGVACETLQVEHDRPYQAIIDTAAKKGCDLIVMASHGRRGMAAVVLGSETVKVLTHSKIPVLVYR